MLRQLYSAAPQDRLTDSYSTFAYANQPARVAPAGEVSTAPRSAALQCCVAGMAQLR